jgi:hypothetical protein
MLWSLIYRKLKGNRGNTMITIYESERLCQLIRNKNNRECLDITTNNALSFDKSQQKIIITNTASIRYSGNIEQIDILPRLIQKYRNNQAFEAHLQAYIVKNIGMSINPSLDKCLLSENSNIEWLGNEVSCGVGMQRIDIAISIVSEDNQRCIIPIELKAVEAQASNILQIKRYIDWIEQYYIPNRHSDIQPVLIAKKTYNKRSSRYRKLLDAISEFNRTYAEKCCKLVYIEYSLEEDNIIFAEVQ